MRRAGVIAMLAATLAASPSFAQTPAAGVRSAESALGEAMSARDADALQRLVADDFVTAGAAPLDRTAWIGTLLPLCGGGRVSFGEVQVVVRETTALALYVATITRDDPCQPPVARFRIAHVWSLDAGVWRLSLRSAQPVEGTAAASTPAPVPPPPSAPPPAWGGQLEITVLQTRGNVNTFTFGSAGDIAWQHGPWRTDFRGAFLRTTSDNAENRHSVNLQLRQTRTLSGVVELFGRAFYQRDLFAGILRRYGVDAGMGFVIARDGQRLQATLGAGSTEEARVNAPVLTTPIATAGMQYRYSLTDATAITEDTQVTASLADASNWRMDTTLAFTTVLRQPLQLRTSYQLKYSNLPVPGFRRLDSILSAALAARF